ncbi:MAG TPA: PEP-CTERM sorting domain-containing protein [Pyrinomonadaceae bacterium]|nr:PEP-CTERM sorting domain-containing protein [Pyrinomonadaceae bacterium]
MSRFGSMKNFVLALAVFAVIGVVAGTAKADIVVVTGVNNQGTDNVLLNPATNVLTVTGTVGQNNLLVNFTSTSGSGLLNANPSGQATVSGGTGNDPLNQLTFSLANNGTFTRAVFNINAAVNGTVTLTVTGINITGGTFVDTFQVDANGQNFFTVTAINGQLIQTISLNGVAMEDVRQVRLGGGEIQQTIPEPASMFLLGTGLLGAAAGFRKRFGKKS